MALKQRQLEFMDYLLANPMTTNVDAAKEFGVSRNTISEWKSRPEFKELYKQRLREKWEDCESIAMETMQNLARGGDYKASKYILDSLGYAPAQRIEADVKTDIQINIEE